MRKVRLIYPGLSEKQIGHKIAIRDELQTARLNTLRIGKHEYSYEATDGVGISSNLKLLKFTKEGALFEILDKQTNIYSKSYALALPMIRPSKLEDIVEKVSQLGIINQIYIYRSEYSRFPKMDFSLNKVQRLKKISESAILQSGSKVLPEILAYKDLAELLANVQFDNAIYAHPKSSTNISDVSELVSTYENINIFVGSEGGFSPKEIEILSMIPNSNSFSIGDTILTTEFATVSICSFLKFSNT